MSLTPITNKEAMEIVRENILTFSIEIQKLQLRLASSAVDMQRLLERLNERE